jgi:hypothetical protein
MNENVIVTSMSNGTTVLVLQQNGYKVKKIWPKKGAKLPISKELLRENFYDSGTEGMFKKGILYIDDMDFKIELGLEEPETKVPTQIIPLDEKYANRVLKLMPISEMRQAIQKMSKEQVQELLNYAANQNDLQMDRLSVIKEVTGTDLFKVIELKRQREE